ncbi:tRNA (adenosine(37)-N6)-threonylcarbamoyltransferase complex dimerization subunit type 1 TsaB [Niveispirillum lacus]|uniref:tRNA (Adenosine(37)-N6)-threonylcarbamoyltransferase complex dimerization subunit type 1 TsaB n=1 Tax=Niveispirillum lacus TaxID=1981099 RepID=A0A255YT61_9PROT|nr:tRNA (adenosine(37)-N6)-threonylcarbamoyltransferase complex dimerization subunit type 1 TsaB [Niveispirillum lacus]OYQ32417.1 tRNA (adenosine(37)-N6)-threonylcarbamoyltransferase complex dimerization subunit type 1 TsaB [Niveispirillum lacus]
MITLGLDTATSACAVALWDQRSQQTLAVRAETMQRGLAEKLVPMVQTVLADAGKSFSDLSRIGVTVGPGTFTGLRVGLAAARGFALAAGCPLVGVTTLEAAVHGLDPAVRQRYTLLAAIESRREDLFLQPFADDLAPLDAPADVLPADLAAYAAAHLPPAPLLIVGDAAARAAAALGPWAGHVAVVETTGAAEAIATARIAAGQNAVGIANRVADPFYLRPPDVTLSKQG